MSRVVRSPQWQTMEGSSSRTVGMGKREAKVEVSVEDARCHERIRSAEEVRLFEALLAVIEMRLKRWET